MCIFVWKTEKADKTCIFSVYQPLRVWCKDYTKL